MQISSPAKPATTEKIELKLESGFIKQNYQLERGNVEDAKILVSCLSMRIPSFRICCTTASKLISRIKTKMTHRIRLSEFGPGRRAAARASISSFRNFLAVAELGRPFRRPRPSASAPSSLILFLSPLRLDPNFALHSTYLASLSLSHARSPSPSPRKGPHSLSTLEFFWLFVRGCRKTRDNRLFPGHGTARQCGTLPQSLPLSKVDCVITDDRCPPNFFWLS